MTDQNAVPAPESIPVAAAGPATSAASLTVSDVAPDASNGNKLTDTGNGTSAAATCPFDHTAFASRRILLKGAAIGATGAVVVGGTGLVMSKAAADATSASASASGGNGRVIAFHGAHQAGVATPAQKHATIVVFDVVAADKAELAGLFQTLTDRARFLTSGGTPPDLGVGAPPSDNGILGPTVAADGLTVTLGVGASLFDGRFGLGTASPRGLLR